MNIRYKKMILVLVVFIFTMFLANKSVYAADSISWPYFLGQSNINDMKMKFFGFYKQDTDRYSKDDYLPGTLRVNSNIKSDSLFKAFMDGNSVRAPEYIGAFSLMMVGGDVKNKEDVEKIKNADHYTVYKKYVLHGNKLVELDENDNRIDDSEVFHEANSVLFGSLNEGFNNYSRVSSSGNLEDVSLNYYSYSKFIQYYWNYWIEQMDDDDLETLKNSKLGSLESCPSSFPTYRYNNEGKYALNPNYDIKTNSEEFSAEIGDADLEVSDNTSCKWTNQEDLSTEEVRVNLPGYDNKKNCLKFGPFKYTISGTVDMSSNFLKLNYVKTDDYTETKKFTGDEIFYEMVTIDEDGNETSQGIKSASDAQIKSRKFFYIYVIKPSEYSKHSSAELNLAVKSKLADRITVQAGIVTILKPCKGNGSYDSSAPILLGGVFPRVKYQFDTHIYNFELKNAGTIKIQKYGIINGGEPKKLKDGVKFVIMTSDKKKYLNSKGELVDTEKVLKTDSSGNITISNVPEDNYIIKEVGLPSKYKAYCYSTDKEYLIRVENGKTTTKKIYNYKNTGNLSIVKKDDRGVAMEGILFSVQITSAHNTPLKDDDDNKLECSNTTSIHPSDTRKWVALNSSGTQIYRSTEYEFSTNSAGKINLKNLYTGKYDIYEFVDQSVYYGYVPKDESGELITAHTEVTIGGKIYYRYKVRSISITKGETTDVDIVNPKTYIKLGGYVWEENSGNNLYDDANKDKKFEGIIVQLVDNSGKMVKQTLSKSDGTYEFVDVLYENLNTYNIKFIYDGFTYNTVSVDTTKTNGSKGTENSTERTNLNNKFKFVTGVENNNVSGTKTTVNAISTTNGTLALKYNTVAGQNGNPDIATYINEQWTYGSSPDTPNSKTATRIGGEYDVSAKANIVIPTDKRVTKIDNINLGLLQKEQPDLKINYELADVIEKITTKEESINSQNTIIIPASDIGTLKDVEFEDQKIEVYLKYKIKLQNEKNLDSMIYEIRGDCQYIDSYKISDPTNLPDDISIALENDKLKISTESGIKLPANTTVEIPIIAKLTDDFLKNMTTSEIPGGNLTESITLTEYSVESELEIYKYATFYKGTTNLYAGLDVDSAVGNRNSFGKEDDTSNNSKKFATSWDIYRTIKGSVFEDLPIDINKDIVNTGLQRIGNGYKDENENNVNDVLVELVDASDESQNNVEKIKHGNYVGTSNVVYTYTKDQYTDLYIANDSYTDEKTYKYNNDVNNEEKYWKTVAAMYTKDGNYSFNGVLPGDYIIRFVWGDKVIYERELKDNNGNETSSHKSENTTKIGESNVTVQDYKSTIRVVRDSIKYSEGDWYTITEDKMYSDALDNYELRDNIINKQLTDISYDVQTGYSEKNYSLNADTSKMNIQIKTRNVSNVDFGIIVRPKQDIEVIKEISDVNLALANGDSITQGPTRDENGNIRELTYATYLKPSKPTKGGLLKMELDSELVHGATLEVTYKIIVENLSEIDYNDEKYYKYGIIPENGNNLVTTTITQVIDYIENDGLVYKDITKDKWINLANSDLENAKLNKTIQLSDDAYYEAKKYNQKLLLKDSEKLLNIKPNEQGEVSMFASRYIANSEKDLTYNNDVEVIRIYNSVGRFMSSSTPGNHIPQADDDEKDNDNIDVSIVPPTGQTRIYYVLGITSLLIIALGVVIIKKKVIG